jgi:sulfopyruvate decarboxylase subunit alpha
LPKGDKRGIFRDRKRSGEAEVFVSKTFDTGKEGQTYRREALEFFYDGFRAAGIDFAVFLPDSMLDGVEQLILARGGIDTYQCSREDEGVAMAMGAFLVGKRPVALMEGSGVGLSALILARGIVQKTPTMLIVGHNSTLGERYDYHGATRLVAEPVLQALNIPYHVLFDPSEIRTVIVEAQQTIEGQRIPVGVLVPGHVIRETGSKR